MTRGVCLYLVGSIVLVSLAGCGRGFFQAEREPWRAEAEIACLKSGAVKEGADIVRIDPIEGPGVCGADYPLRISAIGEGAPAYGFADEDLRPPAPIGNQPRWPIARPPASTPPAAAYQQGPARAYPQDLPTPRAYPQQFPNKPISLMAPGMPRDEDEIDLPPDGVPPAYVPGRAPSTVPPTVPQQAYPMRAGAPFNPAQYPQRGDGAPFGAGGGNPVAEVGAVAVRPPATLACPIVSVLDRWLAQSVQPAAQRWFGARVIEIRQISAYSCRGMNGNPRAHISEHAFGNALDIAAFTLADGRRIVVKDGWYGLPEEQGFLRDVQGTACQQFATVLAPGSNAYHRDHIHVDLMRRASRRTICEPDPISGEEIAARAAHRSRYSAREPWATGALGGRRPGATARRDKVDSEDGAEDE